jgi:hypothetical protein
VNVHVDVAGPQTTSVDLVGGGGASPYLAVRLGRALIYAHDRESVRTFQEAWQLAHQHGTTLLPGELRRPLPTVADIAVVYAALGASDSNVVGISTEAAPHGMAHVIVRVGPLTTRAFDRQAVAEHLAAWTLADQLCDRAFPDPDGPFTRRRTRASRTTPAEPV